MATIHVFRATFKRGERWSLGAAWWMAALMSLLFQVIPLLVVVDLPPDIRWNVALLVPALAGWIAASVAWSHNRDLKKYTRPVAELRP